MSVATAILLCTLWTRIVAFAPSTPQSILNNDRTRQLHSSLAETPAAKIKWAELNGGCRLLLPESAPPKAIVHFLGGAFVSPKPTFAYRYVLEQLAALGYAVVATPFAVDFDYRKPAASIHEKFEAARGELDERGCESLPVVGLGHSLGALMHVLLSCEYAADARAATRGTALVSYNNKSVDGAIPAFKEVFVPALGPLEPLTREDSVIREAIARVQEARSAEFRRLRRAVVGVQDVLGLKEGESLVPGVPPLILRGLDDLEAAAGLVDQLPDVLASIAQGASEFEPTPAEMRGLVASSCTLRSPLLVRFAGDAIDESGELLEILPAAARAELVELQGSHVTPLAIDPNAPSTPLLPIPEVLADGGLRNALLDNADALVQALDEYFLKSIESVVAGQVGDSVSDDALGEVVADNVDTNVDVES